MSKSSDYIRIPRTISQLTDQVRLICDDYWAGETSEAVLREYLEYTATNGKLLKDGDLRASIEDKLGIAKSNLVRQMLKLNK
jgi:uncharacterized protein (TIGR04540 family)